MFGFGVISSGFREDYDYGRKKYIARFARWTEYFLFERD